jgi:cation transport ATPase
LVTKVYSSLTTAIGHRPTSFCSTQTNWLDTAARLGKLCFVSSVLIAALCVFLRNDIRVAVAVLISGCTPALGFSVSALLRGALEQLKRDGTSCPEARYLERLAHAKAVIFDESLLQSMAAWSSPSSVQYPEHQSIREVVSILTGEKIKTVLFTGKLLPEANRMAARLGISCTEAELFQEDKPCKVRAWKRKCRPVVAVVDATILATDYTEADVVVAVCSSCPPGRAFGNFGLTVPTVGHLPRILLVAHRARTAAFLITLIATLLTSCAIGLASAGRIGPQQAFVLRLAVDLSCLFIARMLFRGNGPQTALG